MEDSLELDFVTNKNLAQSVSFGPNIKPNLLNSEVPDVPDYIDDFLQISPEAVFIDGNKRVPKKKKIKKIVKKKIKKKINKNFNSVDIKISDLKKEELVGTKNKTEQKEKTDKNIESQREIQSYINKAKITKDDFSSKKSNENDNKKKDIKKNIKKDVKEEDKKENINKVDNDKGQDKDKNESNKVEESKTKIEENQNKNEDKKEKQNEENAKEETKKEQEIKESKKKEDKNEEEKKEENKIEKNIKEENKKEENIKEEETKENNKKEEEEKTELKEIKIDDKIENNKADDSNGLNVDKSIERKKEENKSEIKEEKKIGKEKSDKKEKKEDKAEEEEKDEDNDEKKDKNDIKEKKENKNTSLEEKIKSVEIKDKKDEDNIQTSDTMEKSVIFDKFNSLVSSKVIFNLSNVLKIIFFFKKVKECQNKSSTKISSIFRGYLIRKNFKLNYLTLKILNLRDKCSSKIIAHFKGYLIRKISKPIIQKKEDNYIIYSTLSDNKMLYFKSRFMGGLEDNIYFEYCKLLHCFVHFINRKERNLSKKKIEGFFYNEKYKKLTDNMYEKNQKGENIINIPQILKKNNDNIDNYDKIINDYMKSLRPVVRRRENLLEYEERKKKALDDDMLTRHKIFEKANKMSRSKSFMRLKGVKGVSKGKGILKPSKSYINLRSEEKKIQFGKARIKGYHLTKK